MHLTQSKQSSYSHSKSDWFKPLLAFLLACTLALFITFLGLRLYFNETRLKEQLTRSYSAKEFKILAGQSKIDNDTLLATGLMPDGFNYVNIQSLHIDSRFYAKLSVKFTEKHAVQPLLLMVKNNSDRPLEQLVLHTEGLTADFLMKDLAPANAVITDVGLLADRITAPYRVHSIQFIPKKLSYKEFGQLLMTCFAINTKWSDESINTRKSPYQVFIPPKILVLIYFTVVGLMFVVYLRITRRPMMNAWWATLVAAWLVLDAHYLVEKTVITKNVYNTFAHLSDDEKNLILSPEAAKLAQMIKSALPNDGKRKKIRIQFGREKAMYTPSEHRYLGGKLHYLLQPNQIYTFGAKIPNTVWQQGGFYYVDARERRRLPYNTVKEQLTTEARQKVWAKRILDSNQMTIYHVVGMVSES